MKRHNSVMVQGSKFVLSALLLLSVVIWGGACAPKTVTPETAKSSLTLLHYFSGEFSGGIDALISGFNREQDQFTLNAIPIDHEAFKTSILDALAQNNPPELYAYWAGARTASVKDKLAPIDAVWEEAGLDTVYSKALSENASMVDGRHYLLPITQHYVAFFYNKGVFTDLGLEVPRDWESFLQVCEVMKQSGITPIGLGSKADWPAQFWFDYLLLRTEPYSFREGLMAGDIPYTSPEVIQVFENWTTLIQAGYFNDNPNDYEWYEKPLEGLASGEIGMTLMGTWAVSTLEKDFSLVAGKDFGYFDFPSMTPGLPKVALGPVDGIIVPKDSVNVEGAMAALAYLARPESQKAMALGSGAISPSSQVDEEIYGVLQREMLPTMRNADFWAFNYDLATSPERADMGLQLFSDFLVFPDAYRILLEEVQQEMDAIKLEGEN